MKPVYFLNKIVMKFFLILLGSLLIISCKKEDPQYPFEQENIAREGLNFDQDSILAALPAVVLTPDEIVFEDGETIASFLSRYDPASLPNWGHKPMGTGGVGGVSGMDVYKKFVSDIASAGTAISSNNKHHDKEGANAPEQDGYAYVYNNDRSFARRKKAGKCDLLLYGIDCSGFVMYMMENAGVPFGNARLLAADLSKPGIINSYLQNSPLKDYQYDDYKQIPISQIKSGDIIYFKEIIWKKDKDGNIIKEIQKLTNNVEHIGIVAEKPGTSGGLYIYQSNGRESSPGCKDAFHPKRGPRCVKINEFLSIIDWGNYGVLRLVPKKQNADLTGNWQLTNEKTEVITGTRRYFAKSVNLKNIRLSVPDISSFNFTADDPDDPANPFSCGGNYSLAKDNTDITLSGCELYERDPITGKILTLTDKNFTIEFLLIATGFTQVSTLYFKKY
jgi:cell wall-associated NlpC family hydrolase